MRSSLIRIPKLLPSDRKVLQRCQTQRHLMSDTQVLHVSRRVNLSMHAEQQRQGCLVRCNPVLLHGYGRAVSTPAAADP